jgi:histidinol-phosphate aminotransferase
VSKLGKYNNLVVLQTFSKAWGLAGLRLGMAFASDEIVQVLNKLKPPYNINILTQEVVEQHIDNIAAKDRMVAQILMDKQVLIQNLQQLPLVEKIYPSNANFLLAKVMDASSVYHHLINDRIIVRDRSKVILCEGCLRISVGNTEENKQLVASLKSFSKTIPV